MLELAISGVVLGGVYATVAISVVLMFRTLGTVNFATTTVGGLGAVATILTVEAGLPPLLAMVVGVAAAAVLGAGIGALMLWRFRAADSTTRSTVTIVLLVAGMALGTRLLGSDAHTFPDPFSGARIELGTIPVPVAILVELSAVMLLAFGSRTFLRRSRTGVQLRALASRPTTARIVGIRVGALTIGIWVFTSVIAALAVFVILPTSTFSFATTTALLIGALAAALVGMLRSLPLAAFGGLALGVLQSVAVTWPVMVDLNQVIPFAVIIVILLWWRRKDAWSESR
jgi:branched-chain amino acid transport system permease protein